MIHNNQNKTNPSMQFEKGFEATKWRAEFGKPLSNMLIPLKCVELMEVIGRGSLSKVFKAKLYGYFGSSFRSSSLLPPMLVAMKQVHLKSHEKLEKVNEDILFEISHYSNLIHPSLIRMLGVVERVSEVSLIAMELASGQCLRYFLDSDLGQSITIDLATIKNWALQVLNGLLYLHNRGMLHCDLKARNVMIIRSIDSVNDLKSVTLKLSNISFFTYSITPSHAAPEVCKNYICRKSDLWSFGVLLWEILLKKQPFECLEPLQIMYKVSIKRETLEINSDCDPELARIVRSCWVYEKDERPTCAEVRDQIKSLKV